MGEDHPQIRKLTLSTALAQAAKKVEQKLPPQYAKYTKVFDEPGEGELPPQQLFDHGIDLKETFIPKVAKSYPNRQSTGRAPECANRGTSQVMLSKGIFKTSGKNHLTLSEQGTLGQDTPSMLKAYWLVSPA